MAHPDEVVKVAEEVPSQAMAVAALRHEQAKSDDATPQEKKQAAVEQAHALSTRPQGSYAQLHEVGSPSADQREGGEAVLAVVDEAHLKSLKAEERAASAAPAKPADTKK